MRKLFLHACCAPCSTTAIERLSPDYNLELFYYNPNIEPFDEYNKRLSELKRLTTVIEGSYDNDRWRAAVKGFENEPEGGKRCEICIRYRLAETAKAAKEAGADLFSTTLTVSPHKNAEFINQTLLELESEYGVKALCLNLKKLDGYKRSIELSKQFNLYRQNYCGCKF